MRCALRAGMRVSEIIFEEGARILAMRCVLCGDVIDQVIVMNRQHNRYVARTTANIDLWRLSAHRE